MAVDFVMCARNVTDEGQRFGNEPGKTQFLFVPEDEDPSPPHAQTSKQWADAVVAEATISHDELGAALGDILIFIHGYNNSQQIVGSGLACWTKTRVATVSITAAAT